MLKVNKLTLFHILVAILSIVLFNDCAGSIHKTKSNDKLSLQANGFFTLTDHRDVKHSYGKIIIISHLKSEIMYCRIHHGWENVKAVWTDYEYDYYVSKNTKF
jgi:hypothetical protein|tara:strand:- start:297 stop:605 length:309 start_codon:yes stop_codon:yes gene_type:complete